MTLSVSNRNELRIARPPSTQSRFCEEDLHKFVESVYRPDSIPVEPQTAIVFFEIVRLDRYRKVIGLVRAAQMIARDLPLDSNLPIGTEELTVYVVVSFLSDLVPSDIRDALLCQMVRGLQVIPSCIHQLVTVLPVDISMVVFMGQFISQFT